MKKEERMEPNLIEQLNETKKNTLWLIENNGGLVDMHGLVYWAGEVERLREELGEL